MFQQLDIFSWETDLNEQAWRALAAREFDTAEGKLYDLQEKKAGIESLTVLRECIEFAKNVLENKLEDVGALYFEICTYSFGEEWGPQLCRAAYLRLCLNLAEAAGNFYIKTHVSLATLCIQLDLPEKAEQLLREELTKTSINAELFWHAGNIFWRSGNFLEARFFYLKAFLYEPEKSYDEDCEDELLQTILSLYPRPVVPAASWLYGEVLPLRRLHEMQDLPASSSLDLCKALLKVENPSEKDLALQRKNLHALNSDFYALYFNWKKTGRIELSSAFKIQKIGT